MARISKLKNAEFASAVAEAYVNGASRQEMSDMFGVHVDTITVWVQDVRVQKPAANFARERANQITRITDREILDRLKDADDPEKMPMELLLKVRKEFLDRVLKVDLNNAVDQPDTINEAISNLEDDPELARKVKEWAMGEARS